jgi:acid phosphatase family membrane protein YuiD
MIPRPLNFTSLIRNDVFLSGFFSLIVAQFIKALITLIRMRNLKLTDAMFIFLWKTGGMPSSHSALAVSITVAIALTSGFTNIFLLSLFFSLIVIRDALGVRRSAGLQAKALNKMGNELSKRFGIPYTAVKEVNGHTWQEVVVGSILGFFIAYAFCQL